MLVWKTQTLNVTVASLRYRCLLPLRYLGRQGVGSVICAGTDPVALTPSTQAIIFVKSFRDEDVAACEQAYRLGVPIILDLCDNIFVDEYAAGNNYVPAKNFRLMAMRAAAIVTTGTAMKAEIESAIASINSSLNPSLNPLFTPAPPVVVIPDGNETLEDIDFAFRATRWQRLESLVRRRIIKRIRQPISALKRTYSAIARRQPNPPDNLPDNWQNSTPSAELTTLSSNQAGSVVVQPTPLRPPLWLKAPAGVKTVLWFGNHGAKYGNFGMANILEVAAALETIGQERPLRLVVVSNSREKYDRCIAPLPFSTDYLPWHPRKIYDYIRASDVVIIPNSQSTFSICKSANRAVLALSQGTPVIANPTPALDLFAGCIWPVTQPVDWEEGLSTYLLQPEVGRAHVVKARRAIAQHLSGEIIAQQWLDLIKSVSVPTRAPSASAKEKIA